MRRLTRAILVSLTLVGVAVGQEEDAAPDGPEATTVYLTMEEALAEAFPEADSVWTEAWTPTDSERKRLQRRLGWKVTGDAFEIVRGRTGGDDAGWAMVMNEVGLYHPITFMVKVGMDRKVERVMVMVYRESRGGEVKRRRFLTQYDGKSVKSPVRINRDIIGITGATLSVRALNAGVKKALAIIETAYGAKG